MISVYVIKRVKITEGFRFVALKLKPWDIASWTNSNPSKTTDQYSYSFKILFHILKFFINGVLNLFA